MNKDNTNRILDFLKVYGGADYKAPKKASDPKEAERFTRLYDDAKKAVTSFGELVYSLGMETNLFGSYRKNVLDGTCRRIRPYFWGELQEIDKVTIPESISLFAEKVGNETRYRVSLDIDEIHSNPSRIQAHNRLLEMSINPKCVLTVNNKGAKDLVVCSTKEDAIKRIKSKEYKKVQICRVILPDNNTDIYKELKAAILDIKPYYDYVIDL